MAQRRFRSFVALVAAQAGLALRMVHTRQDTTVAYRQELMNYKDMQYYGNITVGNQTLRAVLDTGSIDFVVLSDKCDYWCGSKPLYHANGSNTYHAGSTSLVLSFGSGQLMATEAYEAVSVGPMSVPMAPFWEVTDANMPLLFDSGFSAIVGLGPVTEMLPMLEYGARQSNANNAAALLLKKFQVDRFGICLGSEPGSAGYFTWNDGSRATPHVDFTQISIPNTGYWMVNMTDVRLGNSALACAKGCGAVVDSGTSLLAVPSATYKSMEKIVAAAGSCSDLSWLPSLRFKLDGMPFSLPPDAYMGTIVGEVSEHMANHFMTSGSRFRRTQKKGNSSACELALMHITMDSSLGEVWILGAPFFRKYYAIFDQGHSGEPTLHTALANSDCLPAQSPTEALWRSARKRPREIDASGLRLPPWANGAKRLGRLEEHGEAPGVAQRFHH